MGDVSQTCHIETYGSDTNLYLCQQFHGCFQFSFPETEIRSRLTLYIQDNKYSYSDRRTAS